MNRSSLVIYLVLFAVCAPGCADWVAEHSDSGDAGVLLGTRVPSGTFRLDYDTRRDFSTLRPLEGATIDGAVWIRLTVVTATAIDHVEWSVDDRLFRSDDENPPYDLTYMPAAFTLREWGGSGSHTISAMVLLGDGTSQSIAAHCTVRFPSTDAGTDAGTLDGGSTPSDGGGAGGIPWPSSANRPIFSASARSLSWTGPAQGGPSTANDVWHSQVLKSSGPVRTTAPGQVIENLDISSGTGVAVTIAHPNCTLRRSHITGGSWIIIEVLATSGTVIEDNDIDGTGGLRYQGISYESAGGSITDVTIRRNNIHGMENDITQGVTNGLIADNWFHAAYGPDCDQIELYQGTDNLVIRHNTFDGHDTASGFLNSGINVTPTWGPINNVTIDNNRFIHLQNWALCDDTDQGSWVPKGGALTNNGFYDVGQNMLRRGSAWEPPSNSGNFVMPNENATSGTPVNGTGRL